MKMNKLTKDTKRLPIKTISRDEDGNVYVAITEVWKQDKGLKSFKKIKVLPKEFSLGQYFDWINPKIK